MPLPDEVRKLMADPAEVDRRLQSAGVEHDATEDGNGEIEIEVEEDTDDDLLHGVLAPRQKGGKRHPNSCFETIT